MPDQTYDFHFIPASLGLTQGENDSRRAHFRKQGPIKSLVRELGQNSLDAKAPGSNGPVRMVFELNDFPTESIPGIETLGLHIRASHETICSLTGPSKDYESAVSTLERNRIPVLRISDYNTTGLQGHENDTNSALAALTRTNGVSAKPRGKGGSYGIGAAAGTFNSRIFTTYWTTATAANPDETVLAARTDLATHTIGDERFDATGFFLNIEKQNEFEYMRTTAPLMGFDRRLEPGTDTFIPAYRGAETDPDLLEIRKCFVENFFAAIREGKLEVEGKTTKSTWILNAATLAAEIDDFPDIKPFYYALEQEPIIGSIDGLGEVKLFVNLDPTLSKRHHTLLMRSPLMTVTDYRPRSLPNYAAVFLCDDDSGNELLRSLEPPTHDDWVRDDPDFPQGKKLVKEIHAFIRQAIRSLISVKQGEEIEIKGLNELLPSSLGNPILDELPLSNSPSSLEEDNDTESATVHGDETPVPIEFRKRAAVRPRLRKPAVPGGEEDALVGNRSRKNASKRSEGGSKQSNGSEGPGGASVASLLNDMVCWFNTENESLRVALEAPVGTTGNLPLHAIGEQGVDDSYDLGISRVAEQLADHEVELEFSGNTILGLNFSNTEVKQLNVEFKEPRRLRLGID